MDPCELTTLITAMANALAGQLNDDELNIPGAAVTQLGDTLLTIAAQRSICCRKKLKTAQGDASFSCGKRAIRESPLRTCYGPRLPGPALYCGYT